MIAIAGTSGLLALFNRTDPEHSQVATAADICGLLVVSPLTLTELHQVASIRAGRRVADAILRTLSLGWRLPGSPSPTPPRDC